MDKDGYFTFGTNNDYTSNVARYAKRLVVEVNRQIHARESPAARCCTSPRSMSLWRMMSRCWSMYRVRLLRRNKR